MALDWRIVIRDAAIAANGVMPDATPATRNYFQKIADAHTALLRSYSEAHITAEIDKETFESLMDEEKIALNAELTSVQTLAKTYAKNVVNAFAGSIVSAINAAMKSANP